ncbi:MAG TPA: CDP-diacylglycerol--serine O-phosphatidyltransferase [Planctomycetota bacterium]|nr:CDP-diacylglycerol--serine O-phosphatidyltransferase [Planctomycetota bacterium]
MEKQSSHEPGRRWPFRRSSRPRPVRSIALLPTLITLGNGVCGVVAIFRIGMGLAENEPKRFYAAAWLILAAMIFDALDGFVARLTKTASNFGAQLDSLCDLISFGVAPGFLVFAVSRQVLQLSDAWERPVQVVCVLFAMCALVRLARFTVETTPDESSHREFAGLPSPAAAGVVASAALPSAAFHKLAPAWAEGITAALPGLALAAGLLMVSRIRYSHVINRLLRGRRPFVTLVEVALVAALAVIVREFAFFVAFFGYAASGPFLWMKRRLFPKPSPVPASPGRPDRS